MPFNLFHRKKPEQEQPAPAEEAPSQPIQESPAASAAPIEEPAPEPTPAPEAPAAEAPAEPEPTPEPPVEQEHEAPVPVEPPSKTYLKAMPLKDLSDVENVKAEVRNGNIIILRITPLAGKSIEDVKKAVNDLYEFAEEVEGDIARLGEERVVICPKTVRIWREKSPAPVKSNETLPTAA
jgi:SepF-like predicted cell division protein (DUF552 family)